MCLAAKQKHVVQHAYFSQTVSQTVSQTFALKNVTKATRDVNKCLISTDICTMFVLSKK
ncbi:hypothetical protein SAMN06265379_104300 [Saccharicrinis carchari]|uniref:Uncharacterized protein n=1 Tax=Saccharicrinis carchari TaxID=1168039 RepID=A0A521D6D8_SACCC|nr:hypothetical protein SAMN06265379_104300 [Saccharicrinis carchari]